MSAGLLLKAEWLKASRRSAVVGTTIFYAGILLVMNYAAMRMSRLHTSAEPYGFPYIWPQLAIAGAQLSLMLVSVVIVVCTAAEFGWKTARQNVIDGLSKDQWFFAKLMVAVTACVFFTILLFTIGSAFAFSAPYTTFIRSSDIKMLGGHVLGLLGFASAAFMLSMVVRKDGGALGIMLLWMGVVENILALILRRIHVGWERAAHYFPFRVFTSVVSPDNWDPNAAARAEAIAAQMSRTRTLPNMHLMVALAATYIVAFVVIAYWDFKRRDL